MTSVLFNNQLWMWWYRLARPVRKWWQPLLVERILEKNFGQSQPFFFIQVGAHDGVQHDSLYDFLKTHEPKGVVIEPLPDLFAQLQKNYAPFAGVKAVNKAVHPTQKAVTLYRVDPRQADRFPTWSTGIASLLPDHHKKSGIPSSAIIAQTVAADSLMSIVNETYAYDRIDLLQLDTEGFDYEILKQIDFAKIRPLLIKFEYINLTRPAAKRALRLLKQQGYWCFHQGFDVIAFRPDKIKL